MISTFARARYDRRTAALVLLLSLSLVLRLLGPWAVLPAKEGYALICTGSGIIQIPLSELGLAPEGAGDPSPERQAEACLWFGQFVALAGVAAAPASEPFVFASFRSMAVAEIAHGQKIFLPFHGRAPPALPG